MRENAAMHGGADSPRVSPVALLPIALIAVIVVAIALLVRGGQAPTIVVERMTVTGVTSEQHGVRHASAWTFTTISETSADGALLRSFIEDSISRPGFQQVTTPQTMEIYDPLDNTIFETSPSAYRQATNEQIARAIGHGRGVHVQRRSRRSITYYAAALVPGRMSVPQQQLLAHQARIVARVTIAGRPALKLDDQRVTFAPGLRPSGHYGSVSTQYVTPETYEPIEQITRSNFPGLRETVVGRWPGYRVLADTRVNQRLLSLSARHPTAHVVLGAAGYIRATQSEIRTRVFRENTG